MLSVQEHILDLSRWHPFLPCFEWKQRAFALMMAMSTKSLRRDDLTSVVVFGRLDIVSTSLVGGIKAVIKQRSVTPKVLPPSNTPCGARETVPRAPCFVRCAAKKISEPSLSQTPLPLGVACNCPCFRKSQTLRFALPVHLRAGLPISAPFVWSVMYALDWSSGIGTRERKMLM